MSQNIDEIDRKILRKIQKDSTLSIEQLAEQIPLSRNACWRRVKRLEENQIIRKRVAIINPKPVNLGLQVFILIRTNDHSAQWLTTFRKTIHEMPEIIGAQRMAGELDYILRVRVADIAAYDHFYQRLIENIPLTDVSASIVMEDIKETTELPL